MSSSSKRVRFSSPEKYDTDTLSTDSDADTDTDSGSDLEAASRPDNYCENVNTGSNHVFSDDILPLILDNPQVLTPTDLLNLRLVNRCWRDAATSVILKQNACDIALDIDHTILVKLSRLEVNSDEELAPLIFKYHSARPPYAPLSNLIQVISTSPKFPSNSIKFHSGCVNVLDNLTLTAPVNDNHKHELEEDIELMRFFSLFGNKIRKLSIPSGFTVPAVQNLLFDHLPNLTCLDLTNFEAFGIPKDSQGQEIQQHNNEIYRYAPSLASFSNNFNGALKIERIYSGEERLLTCSKVELLEKIISLSPNIRVVKEVGVLAFFILIKIKKAHLIKYLKFNPPSNLRFLSLIAGMCGIQDKFCLLQLSGLTVKLSNVSGCPAAYETVTKIINMILRGNKDTLKYFELHVNPQTFLVNIQIPPMKKLKCLKLVKENATFATQLRSQEAAPGRARLITPENVPAVDRDRDGWAYDHHVFQFENPENPNRIPPNYFPALTKVILDVDPVAMNTCNMLLAFFSLEHKRLDNREMVSGDIVSGVTTLEITSFPHVHHELGKLFPNLLNLKIECVTLGGLCNWVWEAFPKLERFSIHDFFPRWSKKGVDAFFTGIPKSLCTKFANNQEVVAGLEFSPEQIHLLRTQPYIGDCANLKEFTLNFRRTISSNFLSKLTLLFAFQEIIHQTKIVFSFESAYLSEWDMEEIRKHLEPVASCIEILP